MTTNLEKLINEIVKEITSVGWRSYAAKSRARTLLYSLLAEIEKEIKELPRMWPHDKVILKEDVLILLHPSEPSYKPPSIEGLRR